MPRSMSGSMLSWALVSVAVPAWPERAPAADRVQECIGEHVNGQLLRKQGRFVAARARLVECAQPSCPALVRAECALLSHEVEAALPSVIPSAIGADGQPTDEPLVSIDGSSPLVPLDGQPIVLDPGEHQLRFQHPDGPVREVKLLLAQAERGRLVQVDFRPAGEIDGARGQHRWPSPLLLVSGGVAALALGSFTYFALSGRSVENDLERCKPNCDDGAEIDRMRSRYLVADVSLGLALVSLAVGVYAWTERPSAPSSGGSGQGATRVGLSLRPSASNGRVGVWAAGEF